MNNIEFSFEKLMVWQDSRQLVSSVYKLLKTFPSEERFALCDQIRRAVISVPSNIAEGSGRISAKEKCHFIDIAFGSLMETYCQLQLSCDLGYIDEEKLKEIKVSVSEISRKLSGLRNHFENLAKQ